MTTLAANTPRAYELGDKNRFPVIASDIIYEGAAVGLVDASGHARPLDSSSKFVGFAEAEADNSSGSAADINVRVYTRGRIQLSVTGAVITDVGQPVFATDDNAFQFILSISIMLLCPIKTKSLAHEATWPRGSYETTNLSFRSNGHDCRVAHAG